MFGLTKPVVSIVKGTRWLSKMWGKPIDQVLASRGVVEGWGAGTKAVIEERGRAESLVGRQIRWLL